jgi:hypothetical protein
MAACMTMRCALGSEMDWAAKSLVFPVQRDLYNTLKSHLYRGLSTRNYVFPLITILLDKIKILVNPFERT